MLRTRNNLAGLVLAMATAGAACGGARAVTQPAPKTAQPVALGVDAPAGCQRTRVSSLVPLAPPQTGSTVVLATAGGRTLAFSADEDDWALHVVDVDARKELAATPLEGRPSQLMFLPDGRLAVLLRDKSQVEVFEAGAMPERLEKRCAVPTALEPMGLAMTPDGKSVLVTSGWGRMLAAFDSRTFAKSFEVALAREPRAVVVSDDGKFAYVSHAVGAKTSRVELATTKVTETALRGSTADVVRSIEAIEAQLAAAKKPDPETVKVLLASKKQFESETQPSCQGYALAKSVDPSGRVLAPQVLVDTGDPEQRAPGYGNDNTATEVSDVAVIDEASGKAIAASLDRGQERTWGEVDPRDANQPQCLLPRAAAVDAKSKALLVSCFGIDQVIAFDELAASPARAELQRWSVASGPTGIAVDSEKRRAVVWSQFDRTLDVLELGDGSLIDNQGVRHDRVARIAMATNPARALTVTQSLGRLLFHSVGDARISKDGRACASCHPDGRDDSLVWATPDGPRRSIMLAGRLGSTAPYAWSGAEADLREHLATTFDRLSGDGGLKSVELEALLAYIQSLAPPPAAPAQSGPSVRRGAELFASASVGCADCHTGAMATDNARHDVKSKNDADREASFNTPSLHFVGGTGPYFHDGRYKTLGDLLKNNNDTMGHTAQLTPDDIDALEAYVRTL
jgi:DNA-binding beta-propeller fold protein YncE